MAGKIFVNYRRDDAAANALNVAQYLEGVFGKRNVFIDIDRLRAGQKFPDVLEQRLGQCDVMVAVIGPDWLDAQDEAGGRRIDNPEDWVRQEIKRALERGIPVIPVTVAGAALPPKESLPDDLKPLVEHHAAAITTNGFRTEMAGLVADIKAIRRGGGWMRIAAVAVMLLAAGGGGYAAYTGLLFGQPEAPKEVVATPKAASEAMVREAQGLLKELGYQPGEIDGKRGVQTTEAIKAFQRDMGTSSRATFGKMDERLLGALRVAKRTKLREQRQRERADAESKRLAALEKKRVEEEAERRRQAKIKAEEAEAKRKAEEAEKRRLAELTRPGRVFKDCPRCPEMVVVPAGSFLMGSPESEKGRRKNEGPQRRITISKPFAVGKFEVTWDEWEKCVEDKGCDGSGPQNAGGDNGWGKGRRPVIEVSWTDAKTYAAWLSKKTGKQYRLLTEAEWEYAARAGTTTPFSTGKTISTDQANYDGNYIYGSGNKGTYRQKTVKVGSYEANAFGLHDMHGNVWEWVQDCYKNSYKGAPKDGSAVTSSSCGRRVLRGGSWLDYPRFLRSAFRGRDPPDGRYDRVGFRLARTLLPPDP